MTFVIATWFLLFNFHLQCQKTLKVGMIFLLSLNTLKCLLRKDSKLMVIFVVLYYIKQYNICSLNNWCLKTGLELNAKEETMSEISAVSESVETGAGVTPFFVKKPTCTKACGGRQHSL